MDEVSKDSINSRIKKLEERIKELEIELDAYKVSNKSYVFYRYSPITMTLESVDDPLKIVAIATEKTNKEVEDSDFISFEFVI